MKISCLKGVGIAPLALTAMVAIEEQSLAGNPQASSSTVSQIVRGEVLVIAGDFYLKKDAQGREVLEAKDTLYVVKDDAGHQVSLYLDEETELDRKFRTGDEIEAQVSQEGYVMSIKAVH